MFFLKKHFHIKVYILIVALFLFIPLTTMQVFAQDIFINDLALNPFVLEIALLANMIKTLSSPFSIYTKNQYSSYDPFDPPYITIPSNPGFNAFPYPYKIGSATGTNLLYKTYETYNPVSFLNSGYPDFSISALTFPYIEESIASYLLSPFLQPGFTGLIYPFIPPGHS